MRRAGFVEERRRRAKGAAASSEENRRKKGEKSMSNLAIPGLLATLGFARAHHVKEIFSAERGHNPRSRRLEKFRSGKLKENNGGAGQLRSQVLASDSEPQCTGESVRLRKVRHRNGTRGQQQWQLQSNSILLYVRERKNADIRSKQA